MKSQGFRNDLLDGRHKAPIHMLGITETEANKEDIVEISQEYDENKRKIKMTHKPKSSTKN